MAQYNAASPYYSTSVSPGYLDVINWRTVPTAVDDVLFVVPKTYEFRPDLLAYHLYNDVALWWVFSARNPTILQDPIFDMTVGVQIYLPQLTLMKKTLGI
jgi:hypothetical protein